MSKEAAMAVATATPTVTTATTTQSVGAVAAPETTTNHEQGNIQESGATSSTVAPKPTADQELESSFLAKKAKWEKDRLRKELEFKKEREEIISAQKQYREFQEKKKVDPLEAIKMLGFTEADFFNFAAEQAPKEVTPEERAAEIAAKTVDERIKAYEDLQAKQSAEQQRATEAKLIENYKTGLNELLAEKATQFKFVDLNKDMGSLDLAFEIVNEVARQSNGEDLLDMDEALKMADDHYRAEYERIYGALNPTPKPEVTETMAEKPKVSTERTRTVTPSDSRNAPLPTITKNRTLSNQATASVAGLAKQASETPTQKRERLIQKLRSL